MTYFFEQLDTEIVDQLLIPGQNREATRLILIFLLQIPLGWTFHYFIKGTYFRHLFTTVIGLFLQYWMYREHMIHSFVLTFIAYGIILTLPRQSQAWPVMAWVLGYSSTIQIYRIVYHFGEFTLDVTMFIMCQVCKLSALAFCY